MSIDPSFPWPPGYTRDTALAKVRELAMPDLPSDASDGWISGALGQVLNREAHEATQGAQGAQRADAQELDDTPSELDRARATQALQATRTQYSTDAAFERAVEHKARDTAWHRSWDAKQVARRQREGIRTDAIDPHQLEERRRDLRAQGMQSLPGAAEAARARHAPTNDSGSK